jgi:hypothetical protein
VASDKCQNVDFVSSLPNTSLTGGGALAVTTPSAKPRGGSRNVSLTIKASTMPGMPTT